MLPHLNVKLQNYALAVRRELGFPMFNASNESTKFTAGGRLDLMKQIHVAALSEEMSRDLIYFSWPSTTAKAPSEIAVFYRDELLVDVIRDCYLWAADEDAPLILVSERNDDHFVRSARNALERRTGLPSGNLASGKRLAIRRIRQAAAAMRGDILLGNIFVPQGGRWVDHRPATQNEALVRLS